MRIVFLLALTVAIGGCSSGLNRPVQEVTATTGADHVQHAQVTAHSFWFEPNRIVVKRDVPVELKVKNGSFIVPHNFSCSEPAAGIDIKANVRMFWGSKTVRFTPTKPGEYSFHCHVDGHAGKGMIGTLVVTS